MTAKQIAQRLKVDPATVRKWRIAGCPVVSRGGRGPGRATQYALEAVLAWRGRASGPVGLTPDEVMQKIAVALRDCLERDRVDLRAGIEKEAAAAALIVVFENCSKAFNKTFPFDSRPEAIRALARIL